MECSPAIHCNGLSLWIPAANYLCISDLHLGYEEALNKQGVMVPRQQFKAIYGSVLALLRETKPDTLVINGDLKHEFGTISRQEWRDVLRVIELCEKHARRVVLIKGNHDTILGPLADRKDLSIVEHHRCGEVLFTHGDKIPEAKDLKGVKTIVIGHEHPALELREKGRVESFKCFLVGKWKRRELIVMPSFNPLTHGTNVLAGKHLSPFLEGGVGSFEAYVVDDSGEILRFGEVGEIRAGRG